MPIYEYECKSCYKRIEKLHKISEKPFLECPQCHEKSLKRLVSAAGFRLKGSGWYETDFKNSTPENKEAKSNVASNENSTSVKDKEISNADSK